MVDPEANASNGRRLVERSPRVCVPRQGDMHTLLTMLFGPRYRPQEQRPGGM